MRMLLPAGSNEGRGSAVRAPDGRYVVAWNRVSQGVSLLSGVYTRRYSAGGIGEAKRTVSLQRDEAMPARSEEHTSELQSLMRISYAVFCLQKKTHIVHKSYSYKLLTPDE